MNKSSYHSICLIALVACGQANPAANLAAEQPLSEAEELIDNAGSIVGLRAEPHAVDADALRLIADRYAASANAGAEQLSPVGRRVLPDLDGRPAAHVSTYARGQVESSAKRGSKHRQRAVDLANAIATGNDTPNTANAKAFREPDRYLTVILGATRAHKRLISMSAGLPPTAFESVARHLVAARMGARAADLTAQAFVESDLPRGRDLGVLVAAGEAKFVFLLPSAALPHGRIVAESAYRAERDARRRGRWTAEAERLGVAAPTSPTEEQTIAARVQGAKWDTLLATVAGRQRYSVLEADPSFSGGVFTPSGFAKVGDGDCSCTKTDLDGTEQTVSSCDDFSDSCCDWVDGAFQDTGNCPNTCTCECVGTSHVEGVRDYGVFIRGVPTLDQQDVHVPKSLVCDDVVAVGCGPIAATALLTWYDGMGFDDLTDGFRAARGLIKWQTMAETLRNDYLGSHCWGDLTWTLPGDLRNGMRNFITAQGESYDSIDLTSFIASDTARAFSLITTEIDAGRPLILGYEAGNVDGLGFIDHLAIVTGYVDDTIYVNTGWGYGNNESYEFEIGDWWIDLLTVKMPSRSGFGGADARCAADGLSAMFTQTTGIGWSSDESAYDDYPVLDDIGGALCDQIGGEEAYSYNYTRTTTHTDRCLTPDAKERLDETIDEMEEDMEELNTPPDPYRP